MNREEFYSLKAALESELYDLETIEEDSRRIYREKHLYEGGETIIIMNLSLGAVLHNYYTIIENILIRIMRATGEPLYQGENWHRDLLFRASLNIDGIRPRIISKNTLKEIDELRGFRHVFRNVYGQYLDYGSILKLIEKSPEILNNFKKDIDKFISIIERTII